MDYQNRAGSKKGGGGIASDSQANLARRKQVGELLRQGQEVPYTFQKDQNESNRNPYIYKNQSGKLVCKLCKTVHTSWISVERHLSGNKHGLNVLRRGSANDRKDYAQEPGEELDKEFQEAVQNKRDHLQRNGLVPVCKVASVKDADTGHLGVAIRVDYSQYNKSISEEGQLFPPFARIVSGLELPEVENKDKNFIVIAYEPFENVALEIPLNKVTVMNKNYEAQDALDEFNGKCTFWNDDSRMFYVQLFFA